MSNLTPEFVFKDVSVDIIESVIESYNYEHATQQNIHKIINEIDDILYKVFNPQIINKFFVNSEIRRIIVECTIGNQNKEYISSVVDKILKGK